MVKPPHNLENEQAVLRILIEHPREVFDDVRAIVSARDLYRREHQIVFEGIEALYKADQPADVTTLGDALEYDGTFEKIGGMPLLREILDSYGTAPNVVAYAKSLRKCSRRRRLLTHLQTTAEVITASGERSPDNIIDELQGHLVALRLDDDERGLVPIAESLGELVNEIDQRFANKDEGGIVGLTTGLPDLDRALGGLRPGEMLVIGGRPATGKTALALHMARCAAETGAVVAMFSLEMPSAALAERLVANSGRIRAEGLRHGSLQEDEWNRLNETVGKLLPLPFYVDDRSGLTIEQMRSALRALQRKGPIGLIIVDYLELAHARGANRVEAVGTVATGLKEVAKDFGTPVIALAQLSRAAAETRPSLHHLRESGDIEAASDGVILLYSPKNDEPSHIEAIVAKHRHGPICTVHLTFLADFIRFESFAKDRTDEYAAGFVMDDLR